MLAEEPVGSGVFAASGERCPGCRGPIEEVSECEDGVRDVEIPVVVDVTCFGAGQVVGALEKPEQMLEGRDGVCEVDRLILIEVSPYEIFCEGRGHSEDECGQCDVVDKDRVLFSEVDRQKRATKGVFEAEIPCFRYIDGVPLKEYRIRLVKPEADDGKRVGFLRGQDAPRPVISIEIDPRVKL